MKTVITLTLFAFIFSILIGIPAVFSYFLAGMVLIFGALFYVMYKYFTAPGPVEKPLPLRIINS